jgi:hypothetical protein
VITGDVTQAQWNATEDSSTRESLSESISTSMRNTIAVLCLVIVLFGGLLAIITIQLRRANSMLETYDPDEENNAIHEIQRRHDRPHNGRSRNDDLHGVERRELTEREIQMISQR